MRFSGGIQQEFTSRHIRSARRVSTGLRNRPKWKWLCHAMTRLSPLAGGAITALRGPSKWTGHWLEVGGWRLWLSSAGLSEWDGRADGEKEEGGAAAAGLGSREGRGCERLLSKGEERKEGALRSRKEGPPVCPALLPAILGLRKRSGQLLGKRGRTVSESNKRSFQILTREPIECNPTRDHGSERTGRRRGASAHRVGGSAAEMQHRKWRPNRYSFAWMKMLSRRYPLLPVPFLRSLTLAKGRK